MMTNSVIEMSIGEMRRQVEEIIKKEAAEFASEFDDYVGEFSDHQIRRLKAIYNQNSEKQAA